MKALLKSKAGVTVLEGVIALGLLALITGGAFGVLLSVSRQSTRPDVQEEMLFAVEQLNNRLKLYVEYSMVDAMLPVEFQSLCEETGNPLTEGEHDVSCMLPPICDRNNNSSFTYTVNTGQSLSGGYPLKTASEVEGSDAPFGALPVVVSPNGDSITQVSYDIRCNGYEL